MSDTNPTPTPEASAPVSTPTESAPAPDFRTTGSTTATDLRRELSDVLKFVEADGLKTVAITRHGKVVAAVVGGTEYKLLQRLKESAKSLAPKLGLTFEAFLDKLATAEHQVGSVEPGPVDYKVTVTGENPPVEPATGGFTPHSGEGPGVVQPASFDAPKLEVLGISTDAVPAAFEN